MLALMTRHRSEFAKDRISAFSENKVPFACGVCIFAASPAFTMGESVGTGETRAMVISANAHSLRVIISNRLGY